MRFKLQQAQKVTNTLFDSYRMLWRFICSWSLRTRSCRLSSLLSQRLTITTCKSKRHQLPSQSLTTSLSRPWERVTLICCSISQMKRWEMSVKIFILTQNPPLKSASLTWCKLLRSDSLKSRLRTKSSSTCFRCSQLRAQRKSLKREANTSLI